MGLFKNPMESYEHTQFIRDLLYHYDSFLDSLEIIADFGCGTGLNIEWWANLQTRDDPPEPRNYLCYAIDKNISQIQNQILDLPNVKAIQADLEDDRFLSRKVDLLWCNDVFQYMTNPIKTLANWNDMMNVNAMLILSVPQSTFYSYNRLKNLGYNGWYFNHNLINLMYMLAVNGFDCRDAYFYKEENSQWLYAVTYKSDINPMKPSETSWHNLIENNLVNNSVADSINKYGYVNQDDIITAWLDKDFYRIRQ